MCKTEESTIRICVDIATRRCIVYAQYFIWTQLNHFPTKNYVNRLNKVDGAKINVQEIVPDWNFQSF